MSKISDQPYCKNANKKRKRSRHKKAILKHEKVGHDLIFMWYHNRTMK